MASFHMKSLYTNEALTEVLNRQANLCNLSKVFFYTTSLRLPFLNYFLNSMESFMNKGRSSVAVELRPTFD